MAMKSCLALFVLVCVAVAVNGVDKCFKEKEFNEHMEEMKKKMTQAFIPIAGKCKEEKSDSTEAQIKECCTKKFKGAFAECAKENPKNDNTSNAYCAMHKLGVKCSEDEKDFGKFKTMTLALTLDDKKKVIEDACTPCEKETHFHICVSKNLKDKCAEINEMCEKFKKHFE